MDGRACRDVRRPYGCVAMVGIDAAGTQARRADRRHARPLHRDRGGSCWRRRTSGWTARYVAAAYPCVTADQRNAAGAPDRTRLPGSVAPLVCPMSADRDAAIREL